MYTLVTKNSRALNFKVGQRSEDFAHATLGRLVRRLRLEVLRVPGVPMLDFGDRCFHIEKAPKSNLAGLGGRSDGLRLDESWKTVDRATYGHCGAYEDRGGGLPAIVSFLNVVAVDRGAQMEGPVGDVET